MRFTSLGTNFMSSFTIPKICRNPKTLVGFFKYKIKLIFSGSGSIPSCVIHWWYIFYLPTQSRITSKFLKRFKFFLQFEIHLDIFKRNYYFSWHRCFFRIRHIKKETSLKTLIQCSICCITIVATLHMLRNQFLTVKQWGKNLFVLMSHIFKNILKS